MSVLTQGHFSKFQKGGKSCDQAEKRSISYKKTMNESTVLPSTLYPRPSRKTYTLFHTITSLWVEFSFFYTLFLWLLANRFQPFWDGSGGKSGFLSSNSLPEVSDDFFRQKSIFLLTDECVLDFCCCVVLCFAGRNIYFPASWCPYDVDLCWSLS